MVEDDIWGIVVSQEPCGVGFWTGGMIILIYFPQRSLHSNGIAGCRWSKEQRQGGDQLGDFCFQSRWFMMAAWTKAVTEVGKVVRFRIYFCRDTQQDLMDQGMSEKEQLGESWYRLLRWRRLGKGWFGWAEIKSSILDIQRILDIQKDMSGSCLY